MLAHKSLAELLATARKQVGRAGASGSRPGLATAARNARMIGSNESRLSAPPARVRSAGLEETSESVGWSNHAKGRWIPPGLRARQRAAAKSTKPPMRGRAGGPIRGLASKSQQGVAESQSQSRSFFKRRGWTRQAQAKSDACTRGAAGHVRRVHKRCRGTVSHRCSPSTCIVSHRCSDARVHRQSPLLA